MVATGLTIGFKTKQYFFDRDEVVLAVGRTNARLLSKAGAFIQRAARSSMRRRKRSSPPGQPPSAHSNDPVATLKSIWFVWDPASRSMLVGPVRLNTRLEGSNRPSIPALHEFGGVARVGRKQHLAHYPARPFMRPALDLELSKLPGLWANSVRG